MRIPFFWAGALLLVAHAGLVDRSLATEAYVTAIEGQPYGVARIEFPVAAPVVGKVLPPIQVSDAEGRILYPIFDDLRVNVGPRSGRAVADRGRTPLLNLIRRLSDAENKEVPEQTVARGVSFLFMGSLPLQVRVGDSQGQIGTYEIIPKQDPKEHAEVLGKWWVSYTDSVKRQIDAADYPAWVEYYMVAMLSGRTGLRLPDWYRDTPQGDDELLNALKLIAGAEQTGEAVFRLAAAPYGTDQETASQPLPSPPNWAPVSLTDDLAGVTVELSAIEPIATRVPPECFYIRYGSFENFLWFRDLSDEYGGDIGRMVTLRGVENDAFLRVENQLHMKMNQLSRLLGPSVIEDQAMIGSDLFLVDGASMGVLFKSKNAFLLQTSLASDRSKLATQDDAVKLQDIKINDQVVSFLHSPDNRVRSFMARDGDYVFVANSRTLMERFLEVGQTGQSLATAPSFQLARKLMPTDRQDTIFAYFSPEMLQGLVSPPYLIELRRRLFAKSGIAMVHMARLAAAQHRETDDSIEGLTAAGFLPSGFSQRPDGSGLVAVGDQLIDTLRGTRGTFLPIADVEIHAVTPDESAWYRKIANEYSRRFPDVDPIMVGVKREKLEGKGGLEKVSVHAQVAPWGPEKYGKFSQQLGPPTNIAMKFAPDDIAAVQAHVASAMLGEPTHLFAAIKDSLPPDPEDFDGFIQIYRSLRQLKGYMGAWPQPGAIDRLPLGLGIGQSVGPGMSRLIGGLYRYTDGEFSVLSFQPDLIQASLPFLAAVEANDAAQIRGHVGNLKGSQIEGWVNSQLYDRARDSSVAGADFLSMLSRQLNVEPEAVSASAQQILGARLQCTLGGQYKLSPDSGRWTSTAWGGETAPPSAPPQYTSPAMNWFRGGSFSFTQYTNRLVADAEIEIKRK
jgi:hypothetical protein